MIDISILKALKLDQFVVFDLETTGFDCFGDKIIEIAGIKYLNGVVADTFSQLIYPERQIDEAITALTGISNDDVSNMPLVEQVLPRFMDFVAGLPLVAHNLRFDQEFLSHNLNIHNLHKLYTTVDFHDTLLLSQMFLPCGPSNHKLATLAEFIGHQEDGFHRALADCQATGVLFLHLIEQSLNLAEDTVKRLAYTVSRFESPVKTYLINLVNYFSATSFSRKTHQTETKFSGSFNSFEKTHDLSDEHKKILTGKNIISQVMGPDGLLSKAIPRFEHRKEQLQMAEKCLSALDNDAILISEAGTGVGKSYAYLIPALIHGILKEEKVIVTTNTKNLQEQIFFKDIPVLHQLLDSSFTAIILKGRRNYLCRSRYENICRDPGYYLTQKEIDKFLPLIVWAEKTATGDIEENSGFKRDYAADLWMRLESDGAYCGGKKCRQYKSCFLQNIRRKVFKSQMVVINHSLLFSDLVSDNSVLGDYDYLIVDEAHNIEAAATKYLAEEYSFFSLRNVCYRLISSDGKSGMLIRLEKALDKLKDSTSDTIATLAETLKDKIAQVLDTGKEWFESMAGELFFKNAENNFQSVVKKRFKKSEEIFVPGDTRMTLFKSLNEELIKSVNRIVVLLNTYGESFPAEDTEVLQETISLGGELEGLYAAFQFFEKSERENYVYWYEATKSDKSYYLKLYSAPLNVSPILQEKLYSQLKGVVLTSATLTIENRFKYMLKKLGLDNFGDHKIDTLLLGSPFDLPNQLKVVTPTYFANPRNSAVFENDLVDFINLLATDFNHGTLVLFTSYKMMNDIHRRVKDNFQKLNRLLIIQGKDGSRSDNLKQFKFVENSFLFGTDSFWEGVDVPGKALEALIIVKLPFAVPTEPVVQARVEALEKEGQDSFMGYSVPEAILKFKQGVGRLIRSQSDQGLVYVLDSRVTNTRWGQAFVNSLPVRPTSVRNLRELKSVSMEMFQVMENKITPAKN